MIIFTDEIIEGIRRNIASHAPERGGALLGPRHTNLVSHFIFDPQAQTTAASYSPSKQLIERVKDEERTTGLSFKGIVHSHPNGMDQPSQADLFAFASNMNANPCMGSFIAPIISTGKARAEHELGLGNGKKLSLFEAFRSKTGWQSRATIEETQISVMALNGATNELKEKLQCKQKETITISKDTLEINGLVHMTRTLSSQKFQLDLFFAHNFPCAPPMALFSAKHQGVLKDAEELQFPWGLSCFDPKTLTDRIAPIIAQKTKEKAHGLN